MSLLPLFMLSHANHRPAPAQHLTLKRESGIIQLLLYYYYYYYCWPIHGFYQTGQLGEMTGNGKRAREDDVQQRVDSNPGPAAELPGRPVIIFSTRKPISQIIKLFLVSSHL